MLLLGSALVFSACTKRPAGSSTNAPGGPEGPGAPVVTGGWTLDQNQRGKLADYKGKVVVLDFYATWCEPCRAETPRLVRLQRDYGPSGVQVIGLNVGGENDRAHVPGFAKEFGIE